jgi:hypothetical protein
MVLGLTDGQTEAVLLSHARARSAIARAGALKRKTAQFAASLDGDLSGRHLFVILVIRHLSNGIEQTQRQTQRLKLSRCYRAGLSR